MALRRWSPVSPVLPAAAKCLPRNTAIEVPVPDPAGPRLMAKAQQTCGQRCLTGTPSIARCGHRARIERGQLKVGVPGGRRPLIPGRPCRDRSICTGAGVFAPVDLCTLGIQDTASNPETTSSSSLVMCSCRTRRNWPVTSSRRSSILRSAACIAANRLPCSAARDSAQARNNITK